MSDKMDKFWKEKEEDVKEKAESPQGEEEPESQDPPVEEEVVEEETEEPGAEEIAETEEEPEETENEEEVEEDYFLTTETTSYRDKDAATKGTVEKDLTIERLKSENVRLIAESGAKPTPRGQQPPLPPPSLTLDEIYDNYDQIGVDQGENAKILRMASDIVDAKLNLLERQKTTAANEFNQYSAEIRNKYGDNVSDTEIREMYDVAVQIREGKGNPVELLLVRKAKNRAQAEQKKKNKTNKQQAHTQTKRAVNALRLKPGQGDPNKHTPNAKLEKRLIQAEKEKDVGAFLDIAFELNKSKGAERRTL